MSTYVLIPGAGGDAWYWHLVAPRLRARGHDVVAVELPAADDAAGLTAYTAAVLDAAGDRRGDVIVVGQSMGAFVAPIAAERLDAELIVLVCPMIPAPGESAGAWWAATGQSQAQRELDEREGRDPDAPFDPVTTFLHDVPPAVLEAALARGEPRQSDRPFADPWPLGAWPAIPTRVIVARHDRLFPLDFARRVARERLGLEAEVIDSGHLPALARPEALADRLAAYAPARSR